MGRIKWDATSSLCTLTCIIVLTIYMSSYQATSTSAVRATQAQGTLHHALDELSKIQPRTDVIRKSLEETMSSLLAPHYGNSSTASHIQPNELHRPIQLSPLLRMPSHLNPHHEWPHTPRSTPRVPLSERTADGMRHTLPWRANSNLNASHLSRSIPNAGNGSMSPGCRSVRRMIGSDRRVPILYQRASRLRFYVYDSPSSAGMCHCKACACISW